MADERGEKEVQTARERESGVGHEFLPARTWKMLVVAHVRTHHVVNTWLVGWFGLAPHKLEVGTHVCKHVFTFLHLKMSFTRESKSISHTKRIFTELI